MQLSSVQPRLLPPPPQGLKVLLVSTDDAIHNCINNQLLHLHYQIDICLDCTSALLRLLSNDRIDLVLSDFSLKDMDGCEFIDQVQDLRKNIPHVVIFEVGRLGEDEITKAYKLGACYILWKPLSSVEINNLWQHVLRRRAQFEPPNHQNEGSSLVSFQQESLKRGNELNHGKESSSKNVSFQQESLKRGNELNHGKEPSSKNVSFQQKSLKRGKELNHGKEPSSKKRLRFVWTDERHAHFVKVVKQLGKDAVPHKILRAMNGLGLTREIVASHLQKHRENEKKKGGELCERIMNNADGQNRLGINNHILAPPVVSSSSYPSSVSGIRKQDQALWNPIGRSNMEQLADQNRSLGTSFEKSNMEQQSITHLIFGMQQLYQNPGTQQLDHALSTSFERNNMEQQPDQTSYDLYAPIRSGNDGMMMTPEATHVDELDDFVASLFNQQFEFGLDVQSSDVLDNFPKWEDFLDDYLDMDVYQEINAPLPEMNEKQSSKLPDK